MSEEQKGSCLASRLLASRIKGCFEPWGSEFHDLYWQVEMLVDAGTDVQKKMLLAR